MSALTTIFIVVLITVQFLILETVIHNVANRVQRNILDAINKKKP